MMNVAGFAIGVVLGAAYVAMLRWSVRCCVARGARTSAIALYLARFGALAGALWLMAVLGGGTALLATAGGVITARFVLVRQEVR